MRTGSLSLAEFSESLRLATARGGSRAGAFVLALVVRKRGEDRAEESSACGTSASAILCRFAVGVCLISESFRGIRLRVTLGDGSDEALVDEPLEAVADSRTEALLPDILKKDYTGDG